MTYLYKISKSLTGKKCIITNKINNTTVSFKSFTSLSKFLKVNGDNLKRALNNEIVSKSKINNILNIWSFSWQ